MNPEQPQIPTSDDNSTIPLKPSNYYTAEAPSVSGRKFEKTVEKFRGKNYFGVQNLSHAVNTAKKSPLVINRGAFLIRPVPDDMKTSEDLSTPTLDHGFENHSTPEALEALAKAGSPVLDYPENFEHNEEFKSIMDTPVAELNKFMELNPDHPGFPVSGGDIAKMGDTRTTTPDIYRDPVDTGALDTHRTDIDSDTYNSLQRDPKTPYEPFVLRSTEALNEHRGVFPGKASGITNRTDAAMAVTTGRVGSFFQKSDIPKDVPGRSNIFRQSMLAHFTEVKNNIAARKQTIDTGIADAEGQIAAKAAAAAKAQSDVNSANAAAKAKQDEQDRFDNDTEYRMSLIGPVHERGGHKGRKIPGCTYCEG